MLFDALMLDEAMRTDVAFVVYLQVSVLLLLMLTFHRADGDEAH